MSGTISRGKILRADLAQWDGKTATASRSDATGGTVTGLAIGNEVDVLQVYGAGSARTRATIADAVQRIGTSKVTLVFAPGTWTIDDNLTIPANLPCHVPSGCIFDVSSGKTLTFNGYCRVEYPAVWTSGAGSVIRKFAPAPYDVRDSGVITNDSTVATANTAALVDLFDPTDDDGIHGPVVFPNYSGADIYYLNDIIQIRPGIHIHGNNSTLNFAKSYTSADDFMGFFTFIRDVTIENLNFVINYDGSAGTNAGSAMRIGSRNAYPFGSYTNGIEEEDLTVPMGNIVLRNIRITTNNPSHAILMLGGLDGVIFENVFINGQDLATTGIYYEFGFWHYEATAANIKSSHARNMEFRNIHINNLDVASGLAFSLVGALSAEVSGLYIDSCFTGVACRSGEALYYNKGTPDITIKPHISLRNINAKNVASAGLLLQGAESASGGYLSAVIAALSAGPEAQAQTDLIFFSLDGFSVSAAGVGMRVSGSGTARNGWLGGASASGQLIPDDEAINWTFENIKIVNSSSVGVRADFGGAIWSPARGKILKFVNCLIAGNTNAGASVANSESVFFENCRFGYNTLYDPAAEATQTYGISVSASTGKGVMASGCYVTTSGGAEAYRNSATGSRGCGVRNPRGTITFNGNWERNGNGYETATSIADKTSTVNTADKYDGKPCYDNSNNRLMIATGSTDVSTWVSADGGTTVTPS